MKEMIKLAIELGKLRIYKSTLELDLEPFLELREKAIDYGYPLDRVEMIPNKLEMFIQIYGVKMLIVCRNAKLEG